jgi:DNA-binding MarR family transcriptional regulator
VVGRHARRARLRLLRVVRDARFELPALVVAVAAVCGVLAVVETMDFAAVRDQIGVSDSVLSKHVRRLEVVGYVTVRKATPASRVRTTLALTDAGRKAFDAHVAELRRITG